MRKFVLFLIYMILASYIAIAQDDFWKKLDVPTENTYQFNGQTYGYAGTAYHELAINDDGVILLIRNFRTSPNSVGPGNSLYYRSLDNGETWENISSKIPKIQSILPVQPNTKWVAVHVAAVESNFYLLLKERAWGHHNNTYNRLLVSSDAGINWQIIDREINAETTIASHNGKELLFYSSSNISPLRNYTGGTTYVDHWQKIQTSNDLGQILREDYTGNMFGFMLMNGTDKFSIESVPNSLTSNMKSSNLYRLKDNPTRYYSEENPSVDYPGDDGNFGPRMTVLTDPIYSSPDGSRMYTTSHRNELLISKDAGRYWTSIATNSFSRINRIFPISCSGSIYVSAYPSDLWNSHKKTYPTTIYRSTNDGSTWEILNGLTADVYDWDYGPDGTIYIGTADGVFKSRIKECNAETGNQLSEKDFGTTIISHGYQPDGEHPYSSGHWGLTLARAILQRAGKGQIMLVEKATGNLITLESLGVNAETGEQIILFDWAKESNIKQKGYSEAAGDALFNSLLLHRNRLNLEHIHFIGHSRGTVVNTLAVERLLTLTRNYPNYSNIGIDQVTNLDAHDWGWMDFLSDLNDAHPEASIAQPPSHAPNNGTIAWKGVGFNDSYYQYDDLILEGRRVFGADNYQWDDSTLYSSVFHSDPTSGYGRLGYPIYDVYVATISNGHDLLGGGYHYSRIGGKQSKRGSRGKGAIDPSFSFFENLVHVSNEGPINRIQGIVNGSFDRGEQTDIPGWTYHNGQIINSSINPSEECAILVSSDNRPALLQHNRLFIPNDAQSVSFQIKKAEGPQSLLTFQIISLSSSGQYNKDTTFTLPNTITGWETKTVDISDFQGEVVSISFKYTSGGQSSSLLLDEVKFEKLTLTATTNTPQIHDLEPKITQTILEFTDTPLNDYSQWTVSGGCLLNDKQNTTIRPKETRQVVTCTSPRFIFPNDIKEVGIELVFSDVTRGTFIIILNDVKTGTETEVYRQNTSVFESRSYENRLSEIDKAECSFDATPFAGQQMTIEYQFIPYGSRKPDISIGPLRFYR